MSCVDSRVLQPQGPWLIRVRMPRKGEGAKIWFYKPEWEKGCDMKGGFFPADCSVGMKLVAVWPGVQEALGLRMPVSTCAPQAEGFKVPHMKRGMLTMDRHETQARAWHASNLFPLLCSVLVFRPK